MKMFSKKARVTIEMDGETIYFKGGNTEIDKILFMLVSSYLEVCERHGISRKDALEIIVDYADMLDKDESEDDK